jgi:hypothetical protein
MPIFSIVFYISITSDDGIFLGRCVLRKIFAKYCRYDKHYRSIVQRFCWCLHVLLSMNTQRHSLVNSMSNPCSGQNGHYCLHLPATLFHLIKCWRHLFLFLYTICTLVECPKKLRSTSFNLYDICLRVFIHIYHGIIVFRK